MLKPLADKAPIQVKSNSAGRSADGALPKAAIPAGNANTPAPTMALMRLKTSAGMVAVPSDGNSALVTTPNDDDDEVVLGDDDDDDEAEILVFEEVVVLVVVVLLEAVAAPPRDIPRMRLLFLVAASRTRCCILLLLVVVLNRPQTTTCKGSKPSHRNNVAKHANVVFMMKSCNCSRLPKFLSRASLGLPTPKCSWSRLVPQQSHLTFPSLYFNGFNKTSQL
jgi:hypothetical protein